MKPWIFDQIDHKSNLYLGCIIISVLMTIIMVIYLAILHLVILMVISNIFIILMDSAILNS